MFLSNIAKNRAKFIAKYFHNKRNDKQNKKVFVHIVLCFIAQNCAIGIVLRNMRKKIITRNLVCNKSQRKMPLRGNP